MAAGGIAARMGVACGIDVSDGLLQDVDHICALAGVGAIIHADDVPTSTVVTSIGLPALELACTGGEDYELVLIAPEERIEETAKMIDFIPLTIIGEIVEGSGVRLLDDAGKEIRFDRRGWDAFK
jgi:thiamine-monophosphate kinase